ncbi:uncharacterized protein CCR75_003073 [Bremia lactucae]|uniref:protein-serine/threonine phosphatase n=1 Tax=Bremia lactucae TaxID=4779 RepID=A0A976IK15_BRELC|nr:hypothetical protein CCR75_003073 [Bremia lactucae]
MTSNGVRIEVEGSAVVKQSTKEAEENTDSVNDEVDGSKLDTSVKISRKKKQEESSQVLPEAVENRATWEETTARQHRNGAKENGLVSRRMKQIATRDVKKAEESRQQEHQDDSSHIRRICIGCDASLLESIEWAVASGSEVDAGQTLGTAGRLEAGSQRLMQAPCKGRFYVLSEAQPCEVVDKTAGALARTVAFIEYCTHPVRNGRTCLMCLAVVEENEENEGTESVNVVSHGQVMRLNVEEAKKFDSDNIRRQLGAKKLSLVLDLDHTLLHAVRENDIVGEIMQLGLAQQHVVKLRPGLSLFLMTLSEFYDLFIYTHGTRLYAEQIVKIIDPDERFFKNRIVARTDTPDMFHKSLKLLFPSCDDSMILVVDDRIDVWKENEGNVFLIEPYHFFKCTSEINNASGRGVSGMEDFETDSREDMHLAQSTLVLKHVHEEFYAGHEQGMQGAIAEEQMAGHGRDVKAILSAVGASFMGLLRSVYLTSVSFVAKTGLFPIADPHSHKNHYLWRLAVDLGATPSMTLNNFALTHLLIHPERLGTQKYVQAKKIPGALIVTPDWIIKCARSWLRVSEQDFLADDWKAICRKKDLHKQKDDASESSKGITLCEGEAAQNSCKNNDGKQPPLLVDTPENSLPAQEGTNAKRGKQVTFAKATDDSGNSLNKVDTAGKPKTVRRSRVVCRPHDALGTRAHAAGVVATGGTFDFLSKIKATKRENSRPIVNTKPAENDSSRPSRRASSPKNIDDAFLRLLNAEQREQEIERKRKHWSTNIKDQLVSRRTHKDYKRSSANSIYGDKRMRKTPREQLNGEEKELDDLEADILGDL